MAPLRWHLRLRPLAGAGALIALMTSGAGAALPTTHLGPPVQGAPASASQAALDFEQLIGKLGARQQALGREVDALGPRIDTIHRRLMARGRAYYRQVRAGLLPIGGGFDALVDHAATVERLRTALVRDLQLHDQLTQRLASAKQALRRVAAEQAPLMVQREAMQRAKAAMQQAEERRAAFARAFGGGPSAPHVAVYGALGGSSSAGPVLRFATLKGRLPFPLVGRAELLTTDDPASPGVRLMASRDTAVRVVFGGQVVFVGRTDHGETVAVDHGEGYYTVYG